MTSIFVNQHFLQGFSSVSIVVLVVLIPHFVSV